MNDLITIVTDNDLDGAMCALLVELAYPKTTIFKYFAAKESDKMVNSLIDNNYINANKHFFIADVNISTQTADKINRFTINNGKHLKDITVYKDHHEESLSLCRDEFKDWAEVDIEANDSKLYKECGASLLFKHLNTDIQSIYSYSQYESIKKMVDSVAEYDTWRWFNNEKTNLVPLYYNILLNILGINSFIDTFKHFIFNKGKTAGYVFDIYLPKIQGGYALIQLKIERYLKLAKKQENRCVIGNYNICVLDCDSYVSEIANYICKYTDIDICVLYHDGKVSLRTNNPKIDIVTPVIKLGGGGRGMSSSFMDTNTLSLQFSSIKSVLKGLFGDSSNDENRKINVKVHDIKKENIKFENTVTSNDIGSVIDDLDIQGSDISGVTTKDIIPEVDWEDEIKKGERTKEEELEELSKLNGSPDEDDYKEIDLVEEPDKEEIGFVAPKPKVQVNKPKNPNISKKKKKPNIKPQAY